MGTRLHGQAASRQERRLGHLVAVEGELLEARVDVLVGVQDPVERQVLQRVRLLGGQASAGGRRQALRDLQEDRLHRQLRHSRGRSASWS